MVMLAMSAGLNESFRPHKALYVQINNKSGISGRNARDGAIPLFGSDGLRFELPAEEVIAAGLQPDCSLIAA